MESCNSAPNADNTQSAPNYDDCNWESVYLGETGTDKYGAGDPVYGDVYTGVAAADELNQQAQELRKQEVFSEQYEQWVEEQVADG